MIAFDTETTGLDPNTDEIVTASIVREDNGLITTEWLLKHFKESNPEAEEKHGISFAKAQSDGEDYVESIEDIATRLLAADYVVAANGVFDITMLQSSLDRFSEKDWDMSAIKLIDIMVLDKFLDKYRRGSRRLEMLQKHYSIEFSGELHDATNDAIVTFFILHKQLPMLRRQGLFLKDLPGICEREYSKQRVDLAEYFRRQGKVASISTGYPITTGEIKVG